MSDLKSKLPDMNELAGMASKLFHDVKTSIGQIIDDYKAKHPDEACCAKKEPEAAPKKPAATTDAKSKESKSTAKKDE